MSVRWARGVSALVCGSVLAASCASGPTDLATSATQDGGSGRASVDSGRADGSSVELRAADGESTPQGAPVDPASGGRGAVPPTSLDPGPGDSASGSGSPSPTSTAPATSVEPTLTIPAVDTGSAFARGARSAPATGSATALLRGVRLGRHASFDRLVFELVGQGHPGYRVRWVEGPAVRDGSGEPVEVVGAAHLEVVLSPASGVDMETGEIVYRGSDRVAVSEPAAAVTDLVRTGDFEGILTWVVGAEERAPFRVTRLEGPTRLVIDLAHS